MNETHKYHLTKEQVDHLRVNRYVESVSPTTVRFTDEFKRYLYQKLNAGNTAKSIFLECGFYIDALGESRIRGLFCTLKRQAR